MFPQNLTLRDLEQRFQLYSSPDPSFFDEWQRQLPSLLSSEEHWRDRVKTNYLNLTKSHPILEDLAKMVVVSPLLDLAGLFQDPFEVETEFAIQIAVKEEATLIQGRIDVLVLQGLFANPNPTPKFPVTINFPALESESIQKAKYSAIRSALKWPNDCVQRLPKP